MAFICYGVDKFLFTANENLSNSKIIDQTSRDLSDDVTTKEEKQNFLLNNINQLDISWGDAASELSAGIYLFLLSTWNRLSEL